tara:strand:+ start:819 stop:1385 length:567 start_codon:yes stop_codon:yes gene_type:complete
MNNKKESFSFRIGKFFVPGISTRFSNINPLELILELAKYYRRERLRKFVMYSNLFGPLMPKLVRPYIYRKLGCRVGSKVYIGREVMIDPRWTSKICLGDFVTITDRCTLIAHKRDMRNYKVGDWLMETPHIISPIIIGKKAHIGVGSIILPGVKIGEGAVIGAGSVVTKNVPPYCIAVGNPAKVIKEL